MSQKQPLAYDILLPILAACLAVTFTLAVTSHTLNPLFLGGAFIATLFLSIFLGLPLYFVLSDKLKKIFVTPLVAGFIIGELPFLQAWSDIEQNWFLIFYGGMLGMAGSISAWLTWMYLKGYMRKEKSEH